MTLTESLETLKKRIVLLENNLEMKADNIDVFDYPKSIGILETVLMDQLKELPENDSDIFSKFLKYLEADKKNLEKLAKNFLIDLAGCVRLRTGNPSSTVGKIILDTFLINPYQNRSWQNSKIHIFAIYENTYKKTKETTLVPINGYIRPELGKDHLKERLLQEIPNFQNIEAYDIYGSLLADSYVSLFGKREYPIKSKIFSMNKIPPELFKYAQDSAKEGYGGESMMKVVNLLTDITEYKFEHSIKNIEHLDIFK